MWLDDCRIPFVDEKVPRLNVSYQHKTNNNFGGGNDNRHGTSTQSISEGQGRFTPNLLCMDDVLNDGIITKQSKRTYKPTENMGSLFGNSPQAHGVGIGDSGSSSRYYDLDKWFDNILEKL